MVNFLHAGSIMPRFILSTIDLLLLLLVGATFARQWHRDAEGRGRGSELAAIAKCLSYRQVRVGRRRYPEAGPGCCEDDQVPLASERKVLMPGRFANNYYEGGGCVVQMETGKTSYLAERSGFSLGKTSSGRTARVWQIAMKVFKVGLAAAPGRAMPRSSF